MKSGYWSGLSSLGREGHLPVFGKSTASECMCANWMHSLENMPENSKKKKESKKQQQLLTVYKYF